MKKKFFLITAFAVTVILAGYLFLLPWLVSNKQVINFIEAQVLKTTGAELGIVSPYLRTSIKPELGFTISAITLRKENEDLLTIKDFSTQLSFAKLFKGIITLKQLGVDYAYCDTDKILELLPTTENQQQASQKSFFCIDALNALFFIKDCKILTSLSKDTHVSIIGKDLRIDDKRNPKFVKFHIDTTITKGTDNIQITLDDNDTFYIKDKKLIIENCPLDINKSRIYINSVASEEKFTVSLTSQNFNLKDGAALLASNIFIPNGSDILAETIDIKGYTDFRVNLNTKGMNGDIDIKNTEFKLKSLANMPVKVNTGKIKISPELVTLKDFSGYYTNNKKNTLTLTGTVEDYLKTVDTKLVISTIMTDDFTRNYLSQIAGCKITMTGTTPAGTRIEVYSKNNDIDVIYMAKLAAGNDLLIEGSSLSPIGYDRAIKADMHLRGNILNIESIKYYIAEELTQNSKGKVKPILTFQGNVDIANNSNILDFGFEIPNPLPSEFLNVLVGQRLFKKGTIAGNLKYDNNGEIPILEGELIANKVIVPSQRLFIRNGSFSTDKNYLKINSEGKFRRSEYKLTGNIVNKMIFPIIVKNLDLNLDHIDIEKLLASAVAQPQAEVSETATEEVANDDTAAIGFAPNLLVIERAALNLKSGKFKEIDFGNLEATMSLDKDGKLQIDSNKFDFAQGISTAKVRCDLAKPNFWIRLGAKDIDSDIMATALMNLKREITGKASGLIILETDDSLKLNGEMKFAINNGTIEKVGLVEYALNFVSVFRNPMAMLSPSLVFDLVNIPEGKFDKISGDINIKDNIINKIQIKSTAPQLATLIMGRFNLETRDASLRIYTKFTNKDKGLAGVLRKLSLSSLANRVSLGSSSIENYYAAELEHLPELESGEKDAQVYLTTVDGDVEHNNFLSALKRIK